MTAALPFESSVTRRWPKTDRLVLDRLLTVAGKAHTLDSEAHAVADKATRTLITVSPRKLAALHIMDVT